LLAVRARLRDLGPLERWALVGFIALAAALRVVYQTGRPFTGDEVGTLAYLSRDYRYLLTHFDTWLTMDYYLALAKALSEATGGARWALIAPSLVAGIAAVPLVAAPAFVRGAPDGAGRLLVVIPDLRIRTASPEQQLGKVQVVTYRGDSRAEIALTLLREMRQTLGRRVSPKLMEHYRLVLDLLPARASDGLRAEYTALYWKCLVRTKRHRFAPPQLLKLEPDER
jgi:hypothetical protein